MTLHRINDARDDRFVSGEGRRAVVTRSAIVQARKRGRAAVGVTLEIKGVNVHVDDRRLPLRVHRAWPQQE